MKVSDQGPTDCKIMLVGEAPGKEEAAAGRPFVGRAGKMLKQLLSHAGIDYNSCYVTNVVDERPPGNNFSFFYVDKRRNSPSTRLEEYWRTLREKIERIKPNIVIPLGDEPLRAITSKRGITQWRGTPLSYKDIKVLPTFHPSYIMRQYSNHPIAELDLAKAARESSSDRWSEIKVNITIQPDMQQVVGWISSALSSDRVGFDIETIGKHVRCISLSKRRGKYIDAISIPLFSSSSSSLTSVKPGDKMITFDGQAGSTGSYWDKDDEVAVLDWLARLLGNDDVEKVGQNSICFDAPLIEDELGIYISNHFMDTMHAWHNLYPEFPKSLSFLCSVLTNYPNYWTEHDPSNDRSEWEYNAWDAIATLDVSYTIEKEAKESSLWELYRDHVHPLAFALSDASRTGVLVDKDARELLVKDTKKRRELVGAEVNELAGKELNPNSTKQVGELLYDELKFPVIYKKRKDGLSTRTTDEEALRRLEKRYPNEKVLAKIIEFRKADKLISTFLEVNVDEDGRMRTSYNPSGTKNFRISSSQNLWKGGMNLQNIPVGRGRGIVNIRNIFIAGERNVFVKGDLSQAEARVVAEILHGLGDSTLHDLYKIPDFDIHKWKATFIYNKLADDVAKSERDVGKLHNHSGNYCAGPKVLITRALKDGIEGIDYEFAKEIIAAGHRAVPGLKIWWSDVERKLRKKRVLTTCLGRRRVFFGRLDDNATIRDAVAFEPQSTVGDVCNIIFRRLWRVLGKRAILAKPILQVHDEVVVECSSGDVDFVSEAMRKAAIIPLYINKEPIIIPIDISVGKNWRDCHEYKKEIV